MNIEKKITEVSIGVIINEFRQVYITTRLEGKDFAQAMEFPGGKIEENESSSDALIRELFEEIDIEVINPVKIDLIEYDYGNKIVLLHVFKVIDWTGEPLCKEDQTGYWICIDDLDEVQFPDANKVIINKLKNNCY